jgi:hypothetical protein
MTKAGNSILFSLCFVALSYMSLSGQVDPDQGKYPADYDTNYIQDFRHRLNVSLVTEVKANGIGLLTPDNQLLLYQTNMPIPNYGFMFSYRWANFQFTLPVSGLSYTRPDRGQTRSFALALSLTGRKYYFRNFYEYFKGYYISNPEIIFPGTPPASNLLYPDLESSTYYATFYYGVNGEKYSHRSLLWQSEIQKKSAGSLLIGGAAGFKSIRSPQDILPGPFVEDVNAAQYLLVGLNIGYAYTLVLWKNFNTSLAVIPGVNYVNGQYSSNISDSKSFRNDLGINAEGRFQFLYEHENFYSGVSYTLYVLTDFLGQEYPVGSAHNYLKFNVGYRFRIKPIKFLKPLGLSN